MRTILVPLDGSTFAEEALGRAVRIARRSRARLELVAVHEPAAVTHAGRGAVPNERRFDVQLRDQLVRYLNAVKAKLIATDPETSVEVAVLDGPVIETLTRHVDSTAPDLIVLTTHARGGPSRAWLGSVTDGLLRTTSAPVLAIRPGGTASAAVSLSRVSRVLVALDGAPEAEHAIDDAIAVAGTDDVEYILLYVVAPLHPLLRAVATHQAFEDDLAHERHAAEAYLTSVAERLRSLGVQVRTEVRVDSNAATSIVQCADEMAVDFIAMATHARGTVGRALLGSVADKVVRTASLPVLLLRSGLPRAESERAGSRGGERSSKVESAVPAVDVPELPSVGLERVLIATDLAEPSERAAAWAARTFARDAELVIVNAIAIPKPRRFLGPSVATRNELCESARRGADIRMRELSLTIGATKVWPEVRCGDPADEIEAAASDYAVDLIVMADHGQPSRLARWLGGTVQRVLRATHTPVLVGRNVSEIPPRRILVAIDESPETPFVLAWARLMATKLAADVVALHAVEPMTSRAVQLGSPGVEPQRTLDRVAGSVTRWLEAQVAALGHTSTSGTAAPKVTTTVTFGDPGPEILATAKRAAADMIVIGRGGAGRPLAAIVGSVTDHVLRIGDVPVLVVPIPPAVPVPAATVAES